jgi:hypothetical protein
MYNMGQQVRGFDLGSPILPMPYADEGAVAELRVSIMSTTSPATTPNRDAVRCRRPAAS